MYRLPILLLIAIIPCLIYGIDMPVPMEVIRLWPGDGAYDLFSVIKIIPTLVIIVYMIIVLPIFLKRQNSDKSKIEITKTEKIIFTGIGIYFLGSFLSFAFSEYPSLALWGTTLRYEGFLMIFCYIIMFLYCILVFRDKKDFEFIIKAFFIMSTFMIVLAGAQVFTDYFGSLYLTFGNPNYTGSYASLIIPFFAALVFGSFAKKSSNYIYGLIAIATIFILIGSKSQAGIVGTGLGLLFLAVILWNKIFVHKKIVLISLAAVLVALLGLNIILDNWAFNAVVDIFEEGARIFMPREVPENYGLPVYDLNVEANSAKVSTIYGDININLDENDKVEFIDKNGENIDFYHLEIMGMYVLEFPFSRIVVKDYKEYPEKGKAISVGWGDPAMYYLEIKDEKFRSIDPKFYDAIYEEAKSIGFKGNELLGSGRGYIWSRSLPIAMETLILGKGPDTYIMYFPQNDYLAKAYATYGSPFTVADKPHSLYLQIWIGSGGIALLGFLMAIGTYIVSSFRLYKFKKNYSFMEIYGIGASAAVLGYMGAGFFNDSIVSVSPIFWIILGTGVAANIINKKILETKYQIITGI